MSSPSWRLSNPIGSFLAIVVVPLGFVVLGIWQYQRATANLMALDAKSAETAALITEMEAGRVRTGHIDRTLRFVWRGQTYEGEQGLAQAEKALGTMREGQAFATKRRYLAPVVVISGVATLVLGPLLMVTAFALGQAGRWSQRTLISGYRLVRRALPALLILLLIASPASAVPALIGEITPVLDANGEPGPQVWLIVVPAFVLLLVGSASFFGSLLFVLWGDVIGLRPSPDPVLVPGRPVSRAEAPGLWQLATTLAGQLGAHPPDLIMVGVTDDFSLMAGPVLAEGTEQTLPGNALYVPLPYLAFHREDEVAAIIGYEIAHFAGEDTGYTDGVALMQADIGRSMGDLLKKYAEQDADTLSLLIWPAPHIGLYAMGQFLSALQSWHRHRVFAADAAVATLVSPATMARALLRREAVRRPIRSALKLAWNRYEEARANYFITFALAHVAERGLDAPTRGGRGKDPSIRERVLALGQTPSNMIAGARAQPEPEAAARLGLYLADPEATVRDATKRFVARGAPGRPITPR